MATTKNDAPLLASEWRDVVEQVFGHGALRLMATSLFASACPACAVEPHVGYGWQPLCQPAWNLESTPYFLIKSRCFSCGYRKVDVLDDGWTPQERREVLDLITFLKHFKEGYDA